MTVSLLTPLGLLLALGAIMPLAALAVHERRARRLRSALALEQPSLRGHWPTVIALTSVPVLLAIALAQPVLRFTETHRVRTDAEAFYVFDVSRSMLAASRPESPTRFDRAVSAAHRAHASLGQLRSGVATLTDRVLPHLFPTADDEVFTATLEQALTINRPPPRGYQRVGTLFEALDTLAGDNFFRDAAQHRLVILFTDGESRPYVIETLREALAAGPPLDFVVVRFWQPGERIWNGEQPERGYRADPTSGGMVRQLAAVTGARTFEESQVGGAIAAARELVGTGPLRDEGTALRVHPLARWFVLASFVPLALLLWRRNIV
jgi:hypothetical protein